jgi:hypothetical protein
MPVGIPQHVTGTLEFFLGWRRFGIYFAEN